MGLAPLYPILYRILKPLFPDCLWSGSGKDRLVSLQFDDGPHPIYTRSLLAVLDKYQVPATFFWLGVCVERSPELVRDIVRRGHGIGLHGYTHRSFPLLSERELQDSLAKTQAAIAAAGEIDPATIRDVRPPNGLFTPHTLNQLRGWGYRPVMWSVVPEDWTRPGCERVVARVLRQVENGAIVVLHDGVCGGQDVAATCDRLIPELSAAGYTFVTVDELRRDLNANST